MDCSDLQRLFSIILFLFSFTYSHVVNRVQKEANLDRKYTQKIIDRIGFIPVPHNRTFMENIRKTLPFPIARRINAQNNPKPMLSPDRREVLAIGTHVPQCVERMASGCFVFRINEDIQYLKEAILWIDLLVDPTFDGHQISFHEVRYSNNMVQIKEELRRPITVRANSGSRQSLSIDVTHTVKRWSRQARILSRNVLSRAIAVICTDCSFQGISPVLENRVIMELSLNPRPRRNKRSRQRNTIYLNVCGYIPISCCLQRYSLNFRRVGWESWVVYPREFTPNYCMGSCDGNVLPQTQHASMLAAAVRRMDNLSPRQRNSMLPCCAPTAMGSFTLMYLDPNGIVQLNQMNNLVAFDCGCM